MLGISGAEFFVVLVVAVAVVPADRWADVARFMGRAVRRAREIIGRIQDGVDNLENEISKDLPIDNLSRQTMSDMIETFSRPAKTKIGKKRRQAGGKGLRK
jgi:Sec-independent protein translocase protein TatA